VGNPDLKTGCNALFLVFSLPNSDKYPGSTGNVIFFWGGPPGVWILYADVSEHSACSIFIGGVSRKNNWDEIVGIFIREKVWLENSLSQSKSQLFFVLNTAYEDGTECSETSAYKIQKPGNHPKEIIQRSEHGESLKSGTWNVSTSGTCLVLSRSLFMNNSTISQSMTDLKCWQLL
jgi:hypothetical protein